MSTVYLRRAEFDEVGLEVKVVDGEVLANIRPPKNHDPGCSVERMPLVEAAVIAVQLSERLGVDIAVIDLDTPE